MARKEYTQVSFSTDLVEELRLWRMAFSNCAAKPVSFAEMIREMLDLLKKEKPDVYEEFERIVSKRADIVNKTESDELDIN